MNNVTMNYQPLRSSPALRKALSFKSDEVPKQKEKVEAEGERTEGKQEAAQTTQANSKKKSKTQKKDGIGMFDFDLKKGAKNFWKGVVSPLQMMVDSPIAAGATVLGGIGIGQLAKKFRRIGIPLVVASSIAGAVDIGKGVYKFVTAKTSEDKEKSFYNVGQGSLVTGLSVLSSQKVAIANADIIKSVKVVKNKPQISHLKAFAECWKKTPKVVGDIFKSLGDNKALATALGVTGATTGAEMTSNLTDHGSPSNDVPDVNVTQDILNEMPQQVQKAAELFSAAGEDPSSAFALKQNMEKNKDE